MNKVVNHFPQLRSVPSIICIVFLCLIISCTKSTKQMNQFSNLPLSPQVRARLDTMHTKIEIPKDLTEEDQIAYVENQVLTTPVSVSELLSLQPIHTLDPNENEKEYITDAGWEKIRLLNRFMRMQYVASGNPMDELRWTIATQVILADYAVHFGIRKEQAIDSLLSVADYLSCGTQFQINQYTYVISSVEYYKTLDAYINLIEDMPAKLQPLFYDEYTAWNKMNKTRHNAYVNILRAGEHYSALPMELESMFASYAEKRRLLLEIERHILSAGKEYQRQHGVVRTADWKQYLYTFENQCADDEDMALVQELDETVRMWINSRQKIARNLPPSAGTSYDNLTADYHWIIVNEEEHVSSMYY